jgi:hypothetical protein
VHLSMWSRPKLFFFLSAKSPEESDEIYKNLTEVAVLIGGESQKDIAIIFKGDQELNRTLYDLRKEGCRLGGQTDILESNRKKGVWLAACLKVHQQLVEKGLTPEEASKWLVGGLLGGLTDILPENRKKEAWLAACLKVHQQLLDKGLSPETASKWVVGGLVDILPENRNKEAWLETCVKVHQQLLDKGLSSATASKVAGGWAGGRPCTCWWDSVPSNPS